MSSINDIVKKLRENRILNERKDYSNKSRDELIELAQGGDQLAVETLITSHKDFIRKMSSKYFLDTGDRDDVEQIATIAFWDAIMKWDMTGNFEAYAGMMIKRKLTDALRSDNTEKTKMNTLANSIDATIATDSEGGETTIGDTLPSKDASPEEQYLGAAGAKELMNFMRDKFSQAERDVIMRYIRGYKVSEIAEETGMKYKSVENALMRVKNKLTDYLRTRESKKIRENIEFSDEEKQILESVITKVNKQEALRESIISNVKKSYENYTESQLNIELDNIEDEIEEVKSELKETPYEEDYHEDLIDRLYNLRIKLLAMDDYLTDQQAERAEDLLTEVGKAEETDYEGPISSRDPYEEVGHRRSDF